MLKKVTISQMKHTQKSLTEIWSKWDLKNSTFASLPLDYPKPPFTSYLREEHVVDLPKRKNASISEGTLLTILTLLVKIFSRPDENPSLLLLHPENPQLLPFSIDGEMTETVTHWIERSTNYLDLLVANESPPEVISEIFRKQDLHFDQEDWRVVVVFGCAEEFGTVANAIGRSEITFVLDLEAKGKITINYDSELFKSSTLKRIEALVLHLFVVCSSNPEKRISEIQLATDKDLQLLLETFNDTQCPLPARPIFPQLFEELADRVPESIAVRDSHGSLCYRELSQQSNQLANFLVSEGVEKEELIGVFMERGFRLLVSLIAIQKAGASYLPLDPAMPESRIRKLLQQSGACRVLSGSNVISLLPPEAKGVLAVDEYAEDIANQSINPPDITVNVEQLAYVIYTSGTTGKPKGVEISHFALTNFLLSMLKEPGIGKGDVMLAVTTVTFDTAVLELFAPPLAGGTVALSSREDAADGEQILRRIEDWNVSVMQATPSTWRIMLEAGWREDSSIKVLCGGEALPPSLIPQLLPLATELWNLYGPTETTVWSTREKIDSSEGDVLVGRAIDNTTVFILNEHGQILPLGATGELHIGGHGLARGYRGDPSRTRIAFVEYPVISDSPKTRLYRTGDLARFRSDGRLEVLGRIDHQLKIRGVRIEPSEVESEIEQLDFIEQAIVMACNSEEDAALRAYLVLTDDGDGNSGDRSASFIRAHLASRLPEQMVPGSFAFFKELPLLSNGKLDRRTLAEISPEPLDEPEDLCTPKSSTEEGLAEIWKELLKLENVGINQNFFDLGGHSLLVVKMRALLRERQGIDLPLLTFYRFPTICSLAQHFDNPGLLEDPAMAPVDRGMKRRNSLRQRSKRRRDQ